MHTCFGTGPFVGVGRLAAGRHVPVVGRGVLRRWRNAWFGVKYERDIQYTCVVEMTQINSSMKRDEVTGSTQ